LKSRHWQFSLRVQVDDASEQDHLKDQLEEYVKKLSIPVHVYRTGQRSGLIRARYIIESYYLLDTRHKFESYIPGVAELRNKNI
jgi:hypothetical protein